MKDAHFEDDSKLVEACINKDLLAWSAFIKKYSGLIFISIANRLKIHGLSLPRQDAEDIRQNILAALWKDGKLENVKNRRDISYWLSAVSGNAAVEYARRKRLFGPARILSIFDKIDEKEFADFAQSDQLAPADELARDEVSKKIEDAVESLPAKEKLIIKLNAFYDKKYHEIAEMLNMPKGTVSSYIKRAKEKLRKKLKEFK